MSHLSVSVCTKLITFVRSCTRVIWYLMICFIPLDSAEPMWQLGIRSARSRWAGILASMVSFFMLADEIALILNGLASISGIPADSNASAVFIQWFPVDSQTALHWPYVAFAYAANSDESRDVLLYDDSSRIVPSWLITHVTHFLFPMSIPILSSIFFTSLFLCVASWKLHPSIRAQSPVTQQLGSPHSPTRSLRSCMIRGQPATCSGWIRLSCIHQPRLDDDWLYNPSTACQCSQAGMPPVGVQAWWRAAAS